ncbi:bifunctional hydroxylase/dehydrase [Amycolatopsis xylanica]|uniref:Bifunctional hydroxylase/dehydrase n=1 Tax=Amycolatopsis xylanica TaxID=589385 RepID=A0A1H3RVH7_9PSEU|nr:FAD-dependent monooxygenase [Amycolatopsis xylanica]SDZ29271.1 bifunctional hydroxylase/dehydrase [Amycolatopsis xylanica]
MRVVVVGAGPAGLMLAGELRLGGAEVVVLEKLPEPTGESRGLNLTARTMEVFDQRGILPLFGKLKTSPGGHFGGLPVDFGVLDGAHHGAYGVTQARTEAVLTQWATSLGADIRRGQEVVWLSEADDGVEVETTSGKLRAEYVVGCDGGRSLVRTLAGIGFEGREATRELMLADVEGCALEPRMIGRSLPLGMVIVGPISEGVDRVILCERGAPPRRRTEPPSFAEFARTWHRLTGEDISHGRPQWISAFGDPAKLATTYRKGRILIAGDAAHVHLPAGGQGLNVSVQDAVNLGWKLAAQVTGWAPPGLLDTYHAERHPVGQRLLVNSSAQGTVLMGDDTIQPVRDVLTDLIAHDEVTRHLAGMVTGLDLRYDVGPGEHPLLGKRLPRVELDGAPDTAELLHPARGLLLDLSDDVELRRAARPWRDRVDVVTASAKGLPAKTEALLVRPDGHVAWAGEEDLTAALRRWFGEPR